jgi:hypothetical protein
MFAAAAHLSHLETKKRDKNHSVHKVDLNLKLICFTLQRAVSTCYFVRSLTDVQSVKGECRKKEKNVLLLLLMLRHIAAS